MIQFKIQILYKLELKIFLKILKVFLITNLKIKIYLKNKIKLMLMILIFKLDPAKKNLKVLRNLK